jgi:6-phosphogluconolactonase
MVNRPEIRVADDREALAQMAAEEFALRADEAIRAKGAFAVALSGGSTPKELYARLASERQPFRDRIAWNKMHFFWGDERHVPPDDPQSNFRMAQETMLSKLPIPAENIHRILAEKADAADAATAYEQTLRECFRPPAGEWPRFDLVLLGLGPEGHTASLFPGNTVASDPSRWVAAPWVEKFHTYRITLTPAVLNHAAQTTFLVGGADKADIVYEVIQGVDRPEELPAQAIRPESGRLIWLLDRAAASKLS